MRSQIILAMLVTAISAAPALPSDAKDESLSKREAQLDIPVLLILDEDAPDESVSKREAQLDIPILLILDEDAPDESV
ncbi:hypothetical protein Q7P36_007650 [Cladosporium allicinum]